MQLVDRVVTETIEKTIRIDHPQQCCIETVSANPHAIRKVLIGLSGRVGSGRVGSGRVGSGRVEEDHPGGPGRGNASTTRNARLAAIHSFFGYAAPHVPQHAALIQRVLAIPPKRVDRAIVGFLTPHESGAVIAAPDQTTWRRDHVLLLVAVHTGLRVSELTYREDLKECSPDRVPRREILQRIYEW